MAEKFQIYRFSLPVILMAAFAGLYAINIYNYPLFHSLSEIFNAIAILAIFIIAWNSKQFLTDDYFLFFGIALLPAGLLDLLYVLSYEGMNIFSNQSLNLSTQLWIAARYFNAAAFLLPLFYIKRKVSSYGILTVFMGIFSAVLLFIFYFKIFPDTYVDGMKFSQFKEVSEYVILGIFIASAGLFLKNRLNFTRSIANLLAGSLALLSISEICFLIYGNPLGIVNFFGHVFKISSVLLIYQVFIATSLKDPHSVIFRNFKKATEALQNSEMKFRSIIESSLDAVVLSDDSGNIIYVNEAAQKIFGYKQHEFLSKPLSAIIPREYYSKNFKGIGKFKNINKKIDIYCLGKNNKRFPAELLFSNWKANGESFFSFIIRDMTESRLIEEILEQSENRFKNLFYQSPIGKELYDGSGKFISANKAALKIFGISKLDEKKQFNLFKNPYLKEDEIEKLKMGQIIRIEYEISDDSKLGMFKKSKPGIIYINELITPVILEKESNPKNYLVHIQDVTEKTVMEKLLEKSKKFAEKRAKEAEKRKIILETIINYIPEGVVVADMPEEKIKMINIYGQEIVGDIFDEEGIPIKECASKLGILDPITKKIANSDLLPLSKAITKGEVIKDEEWLLKNSGGKLIPISCSAGPIKGKDGGITGAIMVWRDMTLRKKNETKIKFHAEKLEKLANELEKFKLAVENASDLIVITDGDGKIIYANNMTFMITGFSVGEILGRKSMPWGGNMPKEFYQKMWETIKIEKKPFFGELINVKKSGEKFDAEIHISPVLDDKGNIIFFVGISRDITKAKEIDKTKSEFISMASHQLRTPLASTSLSIELLLKGAAGEFSKDQKNYLKQIHGDIWGMAGLIDAFLNISRIEMGIFIMDPKPTDIKKISDSSISKVQNQIGQKKIKLQKRYQKDLPIINIDPVMIKTVMENLLTNAVKYTPEKGKITVEISSKNQKIIVTVSDTGFGIPKVQQRHIFKKLFRASNTSKTEGMGLGLYVVKSIVKKLGGEVSFKSKEGHGTSFNMTIPIKKINVISDHTGLISDNTLK